MIPLTHEEVLECALEQQQKMDEHKYFKSIEAEHDVGKEFAYMDWIINYAKAWRDAWLQRREERLRHAAQQSQNN
ncbi:MAG TPA: hypothetical protein PLL36_10495 [Candidatus Hydrogenedentes bacterium]|nr:hypothetical protein [Candidatus Hydrogenedentota bacterium]HQN01497.1 hypothetical protein [Candidatus Hydrogenedentota bacterium]